MSDHNVIDFNQKLDSLFNAVEKPAAEDASARPGDAAEPEPAGGDGDDKVLPFEKLSLLPALGDPYGRAHAIPIKGSVPMLVLLLKDGSRPTFSYGDMRFIDVLPPKQPGDGPGLLLRFMGVGSAELEGTNLDRLHGYLYLHRIAWIRQLPFGRTVKDDSAVVITGIKVTLLES